MQDQYSCDIGDFAKFGLLRGLFVVEPPLRLGVLWYRVPDEARTNDGRHIGYLEPTPMNRERFRACDHELYDTLGALVEAGKRAVSALSESELLPADTVYHDEPLSYLHVSREKRDAHRKRWLTTVHAVAAAAAVIFVDPDNGLEVGTDRHDPKGPKYVFYDDLIPLSDAGKTIVIYQHANRNEPFAQQIQRRSTALQTALDRPAKAFIAVRWRRISPRAFIVALGDDHSEMIRERLKRFLAGPWGAHFEQVEL